jgi:SAM-dependent methyltransferase
VEINAPSPCPLCGGEDFKVIYPDRLSNISECRTCDLAFFRPLPTEDYLGEYYSSEDGYLPSIEENRVQFEGAPDEWRRTALHILDDLRKNGLQESGVPILDVGCAWGFYLHFAKQEGYEVHGLELSSETSAWARERDLDVRTGHLGTTDFESDFFHAITMNNVLEHSINPKRDLQKVFDLLVPGGLAYIAVPNWHSLVAEVDGFYWKMKSWPNHLFYFTQKTLPALMESVGFSIVQWFSQIGESDVADDYRILRDRLKISADADLEDAVSFLGKKGKGQELVVVARKPMGESDEGSEEPCEESKEEPTEESEDEGNLEVDSLIQ